LGERKDQRGLGLKNYFQAPLGKLGSWDGNRQPKELLGIGPRRLIGHLKTPGKVFTHFWMRPTHFKALETPF